MCWCSPCCCSRWCANTEGITPANVLLAIFVPPLAIYRKKGVTTHFWISLLLTTSGLAPGSIHGVWIICN
ncbi:hypothetical protein SLEP1_g4487 [Rubroshorea leprosula]|uniref:Proteolipid membrane potential modulator n=1 Tax=Rubroshorea leprosula TaxID=152421 RepID=A0AAV5HWZ7_9ROSI|nr:hypothetical protein SLEP1_g4487 [Rubroshorea leprosula]